MAISFTFVPINIFYSFLLFIILKISQNNIDLVLNIFYNLITTKN
nr:MAG TPA: hypothetical protein [Caudoviricetes sp.]